MLYLYTGAYYAPFSVLKRKKRHACDWSHCTVICVQIFNKLTELSVNRILLLCPLMRKNQNVSTNALIVVNPLIQSLHWQRIELTCTQKSGSQSNYGTNSVFYY
jgi:hypothetical protein